MAVLNDKSDSKVCFGKVMGVSEMWSVKLRFLHNKAHRGTEWTELNTMHRGVDGTKSDRDEAYRIPMPLGVNASCIHL